MIEEAVLGALVKLVADVVKDRVGGWISGGDKVKLFDAQLGKATRKYAGNYARRYGFLKVACVRLNEPIRLEEVYTSVQLLNRKQRNYFESVDALQELYREQGKRRFSFEDLEKQQGIAVANNRQYLMVLGQPGVGKSTFLKKVGLEALRGKQGSFEHECLPVFLDLKLFSSKEITAQGLIEKEFETCGFPNPDNVVQTMLDKGKLLILMDGLDEVPADIEDYAIRQMVDLADRYGDNRFIFSCRVASYRGGFNQFTDVVMAEFEDEQIEQFIQKFFTTVRDREAKTAEACWKLLQRHEYAAAKELAQTP
ncbi:MAG: NACHT domain-containing protein, partial [Cyanobacteria bacterium P01_D01_bin.123]